jgi:hypothetical protein
MGRASRAHRLLEDRIRFETLLSDLSARLIHIDAGGLDAALESGLRQMVGFLGWTAATSTNTSTDGPAFGSRGPSPASRRFRRELCAPRDTLPPVDTATGWRPDARRAVL